MEKFLGPMIELNGDFWSSTVWPGNLGQQM